MVGRKMGCKEVVLQQEEIDQIVQSVTVPESGFVAERISRDLPNLLLSWCSCLP